MVLQQQEEIINDIKKEMRLVIQYFHDEIKNIRSNQLNTEIFNMIKINYYNSFVSIKDISSIKKEISTRSIIITPWEKDYLHKINKAILESDLSLNTQIINKLSIKINIPPITEERRKDFLKLLKKKTEENKIKIRNIRRYFNNLLKKELDKDIKRQISVLINKITNNFIDDINIISKKKENDLFII